MLTCIVYHVTLLYSRTSQTGVHDNIWRVLQKERLLTYGVISPGQSRGISPLQVVAELVLSLLL